MVAAFGGTRYRVHGKWCTEERGGGDELFPRSILLATDGSEEARLATRAAIDFSKATGAEVQVVCVLPTAGELIGPHNYPADRRESLFEAAERVARTFLEEQAERFRRREGSRDASQDGTSLQRSREDQRGTRHRDIVLGHRGLSAVNRALMGSVSDSVVRHAHRPVFVVRGHEAR